MALTYTQYGPYQNTGGAGTAAISTASISYTAGQPIVVEAEAGVSLSISDTAGLSWVLLASQSVSAFQYVWYAIPGSAGSTTITVTQSSGTGYFVIGSVRTYTGAGTPTNAILGNLAATGAVTPFSQNITPTTSGSAVWLACASTFGPGAPTPASLNTLYASYQISGTSSAFSIGPTTQPLTSNATFTLGGSTTADFQQMEWIAYEVPSGVAGPPTISAQPTQQAYTAGGTATFSVTATGGNVPLSYQWQSATGSIGSNVPGTFSNVSGATGSSYTTGTLSAANEGTWYRCVVTDSASQTVTSFPARIMLSGVGAQGRGLLYGPTGWAQQSKIKNASGYQLLRRQMLSNDTLSTQKTVWNNWFFPQSSATAYGLSGAYGSYAVTGKAATVAFNRKLAGSNGSYAVSGQAATLTYTPGSTGVHYALSGAYGSYTVTGQAATVAFNRKLSGANGSYSVTGQAATVNYGRKLSGANGSYAVTGEAAQVAFSRKLSGANGSYAVNGQAATLAYTPGTSGTHYTLSGAYGSYAVTGEAAQYKYGRVLGGSYGSYVVTGQAATLTYTSHQPTNYTLSGAYGTYLINGLDAVLQYGLTSTGGGGYDDDKPKKKKRYVVEVDGKIQVFASAQSANNALERAKPEEAQPKKVRKPVPVKTVKVDDLKDMAREREALDLVNQQLAQMQYEKLLRMYEDWQDEEDIEALLMAI